MARIDRVQKRFLSEICVAQLEALKDYRLAPLSGRRDISMLGALHKINLDLAPPQFEALFPKLGRTVEHLFRQRLRYWRPLH